jgi:hypothetical protein
MQKKHDWPQRYRYFREWWIRQVENKLNGASIVDIKTRQPISIEDYAARKEPTELDLVKFLIDLKLSVLFNYDKEMCICEAKDDDNCYTKTRPTRYLALEAIILDILKKYEILGY